MYEVMGKTCMGKDDREELVDLTDENQYRAENILNFSNLSNMYND